MTYYIGKLSKSLDNVIKLHISDGLNGKEFTESLPETILRIKLMHDIYKTKYYVNGEWKEGEEVHLVEVQGNSYLRTDRNEIPEDNLGEIEGWKLLRKNPNSL